MQTVCQKQIKSFIMLIFKRLWAPFFIMLGISIISGTAGIQTGRFSFVGLDKVAHFLIFGLLAISWIRIFPDPGLGGSPRLGLAVLFTTLFGLTDELHQVSNPKRTFEWADLMADFFGALVASLSYLHLVWWRSLLELQFGDALRLRFRQKAANSAR